MTRSTLISKGVIYAPAIGWVAFTLSGIAEYITKLNHVDIAQTRNNVVQGCRRSCWAPHALLLSSAIVEVAALGYLGLGPAGSRVGKPAH